MRRILELKKDRNPKYWKFHSIPWTKKEWYEFECPKYGMIEKILDFVVDEFAIKQVIKQGEIYWIELNEPTGSEPTYRHPHLVLQNNLFNQSRINSSSIVI